MSVLRPCSPWAEVDLSAIADNVLGLKRQLAPQVGLMIAVKADAYGHGAVAVAQAALAHGATALGVARLEEGIALRQAGIAAPILVFAPTPALLAGDYAKHDITASIGSAAEAAAVAASLQPSQVLSVHLEIDTGMGRLGLFVQGGDERVQAAVVAAEVQAIRSLASIRLEGIYTHLAEADVDASRHTVTQLWRFRHAVRVMTARGICPPLCHAANSAAILRHPAAQFSMVRAGLAVYGLNPLSGRRCPLPLRPALALKARVLHLKSVPAGTTISYGRTYRAERSTVIATIPIGYGDGYPRALSNRAAMLVRGRRARIVGRVCMDLVMLDVGSIPGVAVGDEVVAIGSQGGERIEADELAHAAGTISYEIVTALTARVRREYHPTTSTTDSSLQLAACAPSAAF